MASTLNSTEKIVIVDESQKQITTDLTYIVDNCVTENPELHPDSFYMELIAGTEREMELETPSDCLTINLKN
jgi:hypothetical protein